MLSSRFAGIPISSSIIDKAGVPQLLACGGANLESQKSGSGVRLHLGMVSGIRSEARPASFRNRCPACVGFRNGVFDMGSSRLKRLQPPLLLIRRDEEGAEREAFGASAPDRIVPRPVRGRRERQSDPPAQMVERRLLEPGRRRPTLPELGESERGGRHHLVWRVGFWRGEDALRRAQGEFGSDATRSRDKLNGQAFPRALDPRSWVQLGLHLDQDLPAFAWFA